MAGMVILGVPAFIGFGIGGVLGIGSGFALKRPKSIYQTCGMGIAAPVLMFKFASSYNSLTSGASLGLMVTSGIGAGSISMAFTFSVTYFITSKYMKYSERFYGDVDNKEEMEEFE